MNVRALLILLLSLIFLKIIVKILTDIEAKAEREIKANKMKYGVISRKDFASFESQTKIKSRILYHIVNSGQLPTGFIPYRFVFDDNVFSEADEFINWCKEYLKKHGLIINPHMLSKKEFKPEDGKDTDAKGSIAVLSCIDENDNKKVYVQCVLLRPNVLTALEDNWPELGRPEVQRFIGFMASNNVNNGIIITTGDFSRYAREYVSALPDTYSLQLIEGKDLASLHRQIVGI